MITDGVRTGPSTLAPRAFRSRTRPREIARATAERGRVLRNEAGNFFFFFCRNDTSTATTVDTGQLFHTEIGLEIHVRIRYAEHTRQHTVEYFNTIANREPAHNQAERLEMHAARNPRMHE